MYRILITIISLLALSLSLTADNLQKADSLYANSQFEESAQIYESVLNSGMESADVYYNLANSYYRLGKIAPAILNYERALRLAPNDENIKHNLAFAESRTLDKIEPVGDIFLVSWANSIMSLFTANAWAYISIGVFVFFIICLFLYIFGRFLWLRKSAFSFAVISILLLIPSFWFAQKSANQLLNSNQAIVFAQTITCKSTPDNSGNDLFILHEGTKVVTGEIVGEWTEITTADGHTGWIPSKHIQRI